MFQQREYGAFFRLQALKNVMPDGKKREHGRKWLVCLKVTGSEALKNVMPDGKKRGMVESGYYV
jgi:hypothetical protein